jgi:hypothetical protein
MATARKKTIETIESPAGEVGGSLSLDDAQSHAAKENARKWIALIYVVGFLVIIAIPFVLSTFKNYTTQDTKDLIVTISGVLSGPLGFIIGYYFKASDKG